MRKELDATQVEQLRQIGEYLGEQRQEQAVTLEEVAVKTYIPLRLLQALEGGQIDRLPEPVFIQGFIRRYADTLGLNGTDLAKTFVTEPTPVTSVLPELEPIAAAPPAQKVRTALSRDPVDRSSLPVMALGGVAVLLLGLGAVSLFNKFKPAAPSNPITATATPSSQPKATPTPAAAKPSPVTEPVQVAVEAVEDAWVWIDADGKSSFEGMLKQGEKKTWTAQKSLKLGSGNAGGVKFSYNQGEPKSLGARGATTEITFPQN